MTGRHVLSERGQASIEAALILPAVMLVLALLLEPACMGYTLVVMRSAASETIRLIATQRATDDAVKAFVLRRLSAVPEVSIFHVGGEGDWDVQIERGDGVATVSIRGHASPLPLAGFVASAFADVDGGGVVLSVEVSEKTRASWVRGDYGDWQGIW